MTAYEDFWIRIGTRQGDGRHELQVIKTPKGGAGSGFLALPVHLNPESVSSTLAALGDRVRGGAAAEAEVPVHRDATLASSSASPPAFASGDIGGSLFEALFADATLLRLFSESLGAVPRLRIKLHMDLNDPTVAPIASLPWELLYDEANREPMVLSQSTSVVRYLDVQSPIEVPPFEGPLRVLLVSANPHGDLDLADEQAQIEASLREVGAVPDSLTDTTFSALEDRLHETDPHVVHFMGHGAFNKNGVGVLELMDGPVSGPDLGILLRNEPNTRLVFLNACRTARVTRHEGQDPFGGVAAALVMAGVPAVIAMQFLISDPAAIAFASRFYSELAEGARLESAVHAGRMKIKGVDRDSFEWATPVVFTRTDEALFGGSPASAPTSVISTPAATSVATSWRGGGELDLLPYMVDRTELMKHLNDALEMQTKAGGALVAVIHGDNQHAMDKLRERLQMKELPTLLNLDSNDGRVTDYEMSWPREYRDREDFHDRLNDTLAKRISNRGAAQREVADYFVKLPAPVMVCSEILASSWSQYPSSVLDDYVSFWENWPRSHSFNRVVVFLFIKYQYELGKKTLFNRNPARVRVNSETIGAALDAMSAGTTAGPLVVKVLPELEEIGEQDVTEWSIAHGRPLSDRDIRELFDAYEEECGKREMPMEKIAEKLGDALEELTVGGAA